MTPDDTHAGYVGRMGRLLSPQEEREGKAQGYHEARWVGRDAQLAITNLGDPERVAAGENDDVLMLFWLAGAEGRQNIAVLYMDGEQEQAVSFCDWDESGLQAAEELFDQLLEGLGLQECLVAAVVAAAEG